MNSRLVLIVRLICHDERVYEKNTFCKASKYKSQLRFPSHNNRTCTKLTYKQFATINPSTKKKLNLWDFALPFTQIEYAALDAWIGLKIFQELKHHHYEEIKNINGEERKSRYWLIVMFIFFSYILFCVIVRPRT